MANNGIRGIRQSIPSGFMIGRQSPGSSKGAPGLIPLPPLNQQPVIAGAGGKATQGGGATNAGTVGAAVVTVAGGTGINVSGGPAYTVTLQTPVTVADGGTGTSSGTSGGVPYYSTTTTLGSSALLAANALVIGGGAGAAPKTDDWTIVSHALIGPGLDNVDFRVYGATTGARHYSNSTGSFIEGTDNTGVGSYQNMTLGGLALGFTLSSVVKGSLDSTSGFQAIGTTTNNSAAAGYIGEYISATANTVSQSNNTVNNLTTIILSAGDWDVHGSIQYVSSTAVLTDAYACVSTTTGDVSQSNMLTAPWARFKTTTGAALSTDYLDLSVTPPPLRVSITSNTTVYLVAYCEFASGAVNAFGSIQARRVR